MSIPCTILLFWLLYAKNYRNRWKFDKVMTKTILTVFETRCTYNQFINRLTYTINQSMKKQ